MAGVIGIAVVGVIAGLVGVDSWRKRRYLVSILLWILMLGAMVAGIALWIEIG
ncbi:hypothetical protein [Nonomuraea typhae]|uniref:hypothetical protein n=1 Tax=Nonomuraea typhae TaxID=2603600 RepID=UPI0012F9F9E3|nr:hypothetical protein [Nonomuraea typhae]